MIRIRQTDDLEDVAELDRKVFRSDAALAGSEFADAVWWVAEAEGELVGFAGLHVTPGEGHLTRAGVIPEARGHGLQKRLIRVRLTAARRFGCARVLTYTSFDNVPSMRSLIACGFKPTWTERTDTQSFLHFERKIT